jgi:electron transfer flavoprotein alpha subunit
LVEGKSRDVAAVLVCDDRKLYPTELISRGADKVYVIEDPILKDFRDQPYTRAICNLVEDEKPLAILFSATATGRSIAPRIAARLKTGLSADCTSLSLMDNGILVQTRPTFGGNLFASILCPKVWPQMATVRSKVMKPVKTDYSREGSVIVKQYPFGNMKIQTKILEYVVKENEAPVDEAEIVVSAGYGAADEKGVELVEELASTFGGAFGASRKLVDAGFVSYDRQIGQTGKTVGPKLYICCGISGAVQHVVGISSSDFIVAIDQDPNAPIFRVADVGIVADLYEFIPKLIQSKKLRDAIVNREEA